MLSPQWGLSHIVRQKFSATCTWNVVEKHDPDQSILGIVLRKLLRNASRECQLDWMLDNVGLVPNLSTCQTLVSLAPILGKGSYNFSADVWCLGVPRSV